jgi:hypothetical protein
VVKEKKVVGGTHTLHSTGIFSVSKKKNNEYFGGDSTVTQAGERQSERDKERERQRERERERAICLMHRPYRCFYVCID